MNSIVLVSFLVSCAYAAKLGSYLPPRPGVGAGAGVLSAPTYSQGGAAGGYTGGAGGGTGGYTGGAGGYTGGAGGGAGRGAGGFAPSGPVIPIISYQNNPNSGDGQYSYSYETGNGIKAQEKGRGGPGPDDGTSAQGSFSYTGDDGQTYSITYTADANGFVPQGAHLPTPPPIPEEILKSLQFNAANPQSEYNTGSQGSGAGAGARRPGSSYLPPTGRK